LISSIGRLRTSERSLYGNRATVPDLDVVRGGIATSLLDLAALAHAPSAGR